MTYKKLQKNDPSKDDKREKALRANLQRRKQQNRRLNDQAKNTDTSKDK